MESGEKAPQRGIPVLVVEDSATQAERLRALLDENGYDVTVAPNGKEALAAAGRSHPAVVISDIVMPEMDGYAFCKAIKSDEKLRDTPVVLLTSLGSPVDVMKGLECGADNFIRKPYDDPHLLSRLRYILANRDLRRAEKTRIGVEIDLAGQKHFITSERQQMLDLLISTYEEAVHINEELRAREMDLARSYQALSAIHRMAEGLSRCTTEKEVAESALERALDLPGVTAGWVFLREGERGFRTVAGRGVPPALRASGAMEGDCLCQRKLLAGELSDATNILECERLRNEQGDTGGLRYHASVPLRVDDRSVGILNLVGPKPEPFTGEDLGLLHGVGHQIGVALERARLYEHLEEEVRLRTAALAARERQQAAVAELGRIALEGGELSGLMDRAAALVAETLDVDHAKVLELLPDGKALVLRAGVGWREGAVGRETLPADKGSQAGYTLLSNEPVIIEDAAAETRFGQAALLRDHGVVSGMSVVIKGRERPFGVLGAHTVRGRTFSQDDVHCVQAVANVIATATERARAAEELAEALRERQNIMETVPDFLYTLDLDGNLIRWNRKLETVTGFSAEELRNRPALAFFADDVKAIVAAAIREAYEKGHAEVEAHLLTKDGTAIAYDWTAAPLKDAQGRVIGLTGVGRDVTERKRLEAQFLQAQKMEGVGRLAGGIAHDFNNMLGAITGYGELLLRRLPAEDPLRRYTDQILKAADRAAGLTRQLLAFSRQQVLSPSVIDLNAVVADMDAMLRRLIGEDVDFVTVLAPQLGRIKADPGQIGQVILNLAVNARDAMPEGGKLTIETANVSLGEEYGRSHYGVPPGSYTMLAASDSGHGMDEATRARIFEPFFTTKEQGKGTGLGLSTVYGIVKQSGGYIWVYSEPGRGTTFKVYLPRVEGQAEPAPAEAAAASAEEFGGSETILLVEDDEALRSMIGEILEERGYAVIAASEGSEALSLAARHEGPIRLLLTDVVMPRMHTREIVERLLASRPGVRVLYMSGYTGNAAVHHGALAEGQPFLQKPFSAEDLLRKVRQVLGTPSGRGVAT